MANQTELQLIITAQNKAMGELAKLNKDVQGLSQSAQNSNKSFSGLLPNLAMLGGAYAFVKKGIIDSVKAFDQSEKVMAEMNAVLKSTGAVSGMTSESMTKLAGDLQNVTTFDDEAILHTENLILTFNQMGKDVIPQVTESILDLA
jgi:septal ring factor EnvC (AmiA/AmiB activator)